MTAQELIDILQKLPKDAEVVLMGTDRNEATYLLIRNFEGKRARWHKCDDIPVNGIECMCKCRKLTGETILRVLTPHVYRDKSGTDWYDENECYGQWRLDDVLGWYPLARLEKELDKGEG